MLFNLVNLPYWIFLAAGVLLYLMVIFSGGGDDGIDTDTDLDADLDGDADGGIDGDFDGVPFLSWLGFGKAPLVLLLATDLSLIGVLGWLLNVAIAEGTGRIPEGLWAGLVFAVSVTVALLLGSLIARPLGKIFAQFGEDASADRLIGCVGTVSSAVIPNSAEGRIGQVDVVDTARNRVTVPGVLPEWATSLPKRGDRVLVIDRQPTHYLIVLKDSADEDYWYRSAPLSRQPG